MVAAVTARERGRAADTGGGWLLRENFLIRKRKPCPRMSHVAAATLETWSAKKSATRKVAATAPEGKSADPSATAVAADAPSGEWSLGRRTATVVVRLRSIGMTAADSQTSEAGARPERVYNLVPPTERRERKELASEARDVARATGGGDGDNDDDETSAVPGVTFTSYGKSPHSRLTREWDSKTGRGVTGETVQCAWTRLPATDQERVRRALKDPSNSALENMLGLFAENVDEPDSGIEFHSVRVSAPSNRVPRVTVTLTYTATRSSPRTLYDAIASETVGESAFVHERGANSNEWRVEKWTWDRELSRARHPSSTSSLRLPVLDYDAKKDAFSVSARTAIVYDWETKSSSRKS